MLQNSFLALIQQYTADLGLSAKLWDEIRQNYSGPRRYYHTLAHLKHVLQEVLACQSQIEDWNTLLAALFYHDLTYSSLRKDNEEKSAEIAEKRLRLIDYPMPKILRCKAHILATKQHLKSEDQDTCFLMDADLSILGQGWEAYSHYLQQVRREYALYPDFLYRRGRKRVLEHFLNQEKIFKTEWFESKYEVGARENMKRELSQLSCPKLKKS